MAGVTSAKDAVRTSPLPVHITFVITWVESQPIHRKIKEYKSIDAALGVIERGTWNVADVMNEQPWLPNGLIPLNVTRTLAKT